MKKNISFVIGVMTLSILFVFVFLGLVNATKNWSLKTEALSVKKVDSEIMAEGQVRSQNEAVLHFSISGKVVYLPFKEGDAVKQGQTIASLDSYTTQKQLASTLNTYRVTRNAFDQTKDNIQDNVSKAQQVLPYDYYAKAGLDPDTKENAMNDAIRRILDQNQANLDNSVIQVELANYAFTLSTLSSPISGVLIHQDITTPQVMATPQNIFTVIDPETLVFRANVSENDINFVEEGAQTTIQLNGQSAKKIIGTVLKIHPDKITLPTGENVYQVDIEGDEINKLGKYKQAGIVLIKNKYNTSVVLVPSWLVLSKQHIWVIEDHNPILKSIKTGETISGNTEVLEGLKDTDKVILNPATIIKSKYPLL